MIEYPEQLKAALALEARIAALEPVEPDLSRFLDALRLLESMLGVDLAITISDDWGDHRKHLTRTTKFGASKIETNSSMSVISGEHVNGVMTGPDQYIRSYPSFAAMVFGFADVRLPSDVAKNFRHERVALMAPSEPDMSRVLEALRLLEAMTGKDFAIAMDTNPVPNEIRRPEADGSISYLRIEGRKYVTDLIRNGDRQSKTHPNFVSAVSGFVGEPLTRPQADAIAQWAANTTKR
jgi:hypothetical protein